MANWFLGSRGRPKFLFFIAAAPSGAPGVPQFFNIFLPPPKAAVSQIGTEGATKAAPEAPLPWRAREISLKAGVSRVKIIL